MAAALLIGNVANEEFSAALAALGEAFAVTTRADVASAIATSPSAAATAYELIVLAQSRPGEFSAADCDQLRRCYPLAAVVSLAGSWCEAAHSSRSNASNAAKSRVVWASAAARSTPVSSRRVETSSPEVWVSRPDDVAPGPAPDGAKSVPIFWEKR